MNSIFLGYIMLYFKILVIGWAKKFFSKNLIFLNASKTKPIRYNLYAE
jgi:hypothetical protein